MAGIGILLQRWRADRGLLVVLVVVIALAAGLLAAVPRLLDRLAIASLERAADESTVDHTKLKTTSIRTLTTADPDAALAGLASTAAALDADLDEELAGVLQPPTVVVDTVRYDLESLPGTPAQPFPRKLNVRLQPGVLEELTVVEGALPDGAVDRLAVDLGAVERNPQAPPQPDPPRDPVDLRVHEFVATASTAESLGMVVGDRRIGFPDGSGEVLRRVPAAAVPPVVWELAAIVELSDPSEPVWFGDPSPHRASRYDTNQSTTIYATGLLPEGAAGEFPATDGEVPALVEVRWQLDTPALLESDIAAVQSAATSLRTAASLQVEQPRWATGLDRLLAREGERRATAVEVLGLGGVSVLGVALALLVAMSAVLALRRRDALTLVRGRGASRRQLLGAATVEFGVVVAAGVLLAAAVLGWLLPGGGTGPPILVVVGGLALLVLVIGTARDARRPLGAVLAERRRIGSRSTRHYVLDALLVLVAAIAVGSLRRRGITVDGAADPLVVAAPVLLAAAVATIIARVVALPLAAAAAAARRGRGMAVPVGLTRAARTGGGGVLVVLLVLGLAVAGIAASVHRSLVDGQARAADERVGADVRIDARPLASLDADWMPPAPDDRVADLREQPSGSVVGAGGALRLAVVLVDPVQLATVVDDGDLPDLTWDGAGPAPLLLSTSSDVVGAPAVGDELRVLLDRRDAVLGRVAAVDPVALGFVAPVDGPFVLLDRAAAEAVTGVATGVTARLVRTDDAPAVVASARTADPDAEVLVRADVREDLRAAPLARGVRLGYLVAAAAAVLATAVALLLALLAGAEQRRRHAAVLAAMGTSNGGIRVALLAEVVPLVAAAATAGVAVAGLVALLLDERLDLAPFTGTVGPTSLVLPHWSVVGLLVGGAVVTAGVAAVAVQGRVDPGALLREGDQ